MSRINKRGLSARIGKSTTLGLVIFAVTFCIFTISRVRQVADSQYSMMVSQSLLDHRSFALDNYALPRYEPVWHGYYFKNGPVYQLERVQDHIYYHFPPGTSILSTPFVAVLNVFGVSAVNNDGSYNPRGEVKIEAGLAALLMALLAVVFFAIARLLLPFNWSIAVAFGGALGTQVYSTASRAMWSETWGILLLGLVIWMLLAHETGRWLLRPTLLATLLSWMFFVRPTFAVPIAAITVYVFLFHRQFFVRYAATGGAWFAAFIGFSWFHFGKYLPSYYRASRFSSVSFWTAFAGNLISPARGLLVYVPILLFVAFLLFHYRRYVRFPRLAWLSLAVIVGHLILISGFPHWWGGHSFGPRFTTGLVPWFVLLGVLGLDAMLRSHSVSISQGSKMQLAWRTQMVIGGVFLFASVFINTLGATSHATWLWNQRPKGVDEHPERLWDWRQPQFLAGYLPYPPPREFPELKNRVDVSKPESENFLWHGWHRDTGGAVWAEREAALVFKFTESKSSVLNLNLNLMPFLVSGQLEAQRVKFTLNDQFLSELNLNESAPRTYSIQLSATLLQTTNTLSMQMPDAKSPLDMKTGEDPRPRSFSLRWIEISYDSVEAAQIPQPGVK